MEMGLRVPAPNLSPSLCRNPSNATSIRLFSYGSLVVVADAVLCGKTAILGDPRPKRTVSRPNRVSF